MIDFYNCPTKCRTSPNIASKKKKQYYLCILDKYRTIKNMKRFIITLLATSAALLVTCGAFAQKKAMDHDVYDSWQSVTGVTMSDDGNILLWMVNPQEGDGTLYVRNSTNYGKKTKSRKVEPREISIPRGYSASLDPSGRWVYCRIKPELAKTRQEKIDKKKKEEMTMDSLAVVDLKSMTVKKYGPVESFASGTADKPYLAYKSSWTVKAGNDTAKAGKTPEKKSGLIVLDPATERADTLMHIDSYNFNQDGTLLALTSKKDKKKKDSKTAVMLASFAQISDSSLVVLDTLAKGAEAYGKTVFDDSSTRMLFMASTDTSKARNKEYSLSMVDITLPAKESSGIVCKVEELVAQGTKVKGTDNWTLNENSDIFFTPDGKRIITGIAPIIPPKDTTIVDFETAQLDIWSWDAPYTQPEQKIRLNTSLKKTYQAVINLDAATEDDHRTILPLTTSFFARLSLMNGGKSDWAVSLDNGKYVRTSVWDYKNLYDVELVNLNDGSRKHIATGMDAGDFGISPEGKYLIWFDNNDLNWHTYNVETGAMANLTAETGVKFYDEEYDCPTSPGAYDRDPKWVEGDAAVLIADRYDIWKFSPDGTTSENLTAGTGRSTHNQFRTFYLDSRKLTDSERKAGVQRSLGVKETVHFRVFNEDDMKNGFGSISLARPKNIEYFTDTVSFVSVQKAAEADRIWFTKGNFRNPNDLYTTDDSFKTAVKLTAINPQMKDYRWGDAELFEWKAYDGTPLKGLVFVPDDVKPGEKLPVMIYFYEKYSESLYSFRTPAPSRSTVNISFYTSRGYLVFIPDIVYKVGHPGESAWNCICSGAEALCEKYSIADKNRMGIQGQSWGGYQTAYLITRTNMFAAAGSGAPVGNMTSAYGGIRWESGRTRAGQYEHGQSRIGKTMWDEGGLELYIENSPVFHTDKVNTPVLIMHNDNDGAVPWYQGIEFFSNLRRLSKPSWLLQYNNEAHNLVERRNCKDLSRRLQQFFDHYLKGEPMPAWMKTGVPAVRKGEYFGFETAE